MTVLIDGDYLVYRCCYSAKNSVLEDTLIAVDLFIRDISVFGDSIKVFLSGKDNFREKVAVTQKYKGNRTKPRPEHYQAVRDYLVSKYNAEIIDGYEADDILGTLAGPDTIIATCDKDLKQIPGFHLNIYGKSTDWKGVYEITKEEGDRFLFFQFLQGDLQDNIIGVPGLGPKKIEKLFADKSVSELKEVVMNEYIRVFGDKALERFDEAARLLFIKRGSLTSEYYDYLGL